MSPRFIGCAWASFAGFGLVQAFVHHDRDYLILAALCGLTAWLCFQAASRA